MHAKVNSATLLGELRDARAGDDAMDGMDGTEVLRVMPLCGSNRTQ